IERREAAEQAETRRAAQRRDGVERFVDRCGSRLDEGERAGVALCGVLEDQRREAAGIAGLRQAGYFDDVARTVPDIRKYGFGRAAWRMDAIMGQQRFLQQGMTKPRAAAEIADDETPAADIAGDALEAAHIDRAGAEDRHGSVAIAECALQGDQAVG